MTTVTQGTTGTYTFSANEYALITVNPGNQADVIVKTAAGLRKFGSSLTTTRSIGPFNATDVMTLSALRGSIDYTISTYTPASTGSGAATGTATPQALGAATAGSATAASHEDHVHAMPSANDVGAQALFVPWSMVDNIARPLAPAASFTPANGTIPTGGFNVLLAQDAGTQTLEGIAYVAGDIAVLSAAIGTWVKVNGQTSTVSSEILQCASTNSYAIPNYSGGTTLNQAGANMVAVGTITARTTSLSAYGQNVTRFGFVGAAAANTSVGLFCSGTNANLTMPTTGAYAPPVYFRASFSATDAATGFRMFAGVANGISGGALTIEPSAVLNMIAFAADSTDTYLSLMINGASGTATKVSLGVNIPANGNGTDCIECYLKIEGAKVTWYIQDVSSSGTVITKANGVVTTGVTLPAAGTSLRHGAFRNSASNAATAASLDILGVWTGKLALQGPTA